MFHMMLCPVRPPASPSFPEGEAPAPSIMQEAEEETIDFKDSLDEEPIVGVEPAQDGDSTRTAVPLPAPPAMTPKEREIHNLKHQPPHRGCPICAANRTPNVKHGPTHEASRTIPLLVGDYCFLRSIVDTLLATCLVFRLYPCKICFACVVPAKGSHTGVVARVARFIREMGLVHLLTDVIKRVLLTCGLRRGLRWHALRLLSRVK